MNSSHFLALGVIPAIDTPSYIELRNREGANWYQQEMKEFLSHKLYEENKKYGSVKKMTADIGQIYTYLRNKINGRRK